ncbi:MAG: DMT family transporter [Angelakisella sp.]
MNKTKGILLTMLSAVVFGFAFTLGPMTYGAGGSNPVTLTFLRNALCLPVLLVILLVQKTSLKVTRKELLGLLVLGCIGNAVTTLMLNIAFSLVDVGIVTTIHFVYPVFVTLGCVMFFKEKLGLRKLISLCIATAGIACFFFGTDTSAASGNGALIGLLLAVASGATYAFYIIFMDKSGLKNQPTFKITFYVALMSAVSMGIFGMVTNQLTLGTLTTKSWGISLAFAILCTVVALSLLQMGIKNVGASTAAILTTFEPITSIIFGVILLGEKITVIKVIACILILIGVVTLSLAKEKPAAAAAPAITPATTAE